MLKNTSIYLLAFLLCLVLLSIGRSDEPDAKKARPANWATKIDMPGLPNLHKIDDGLYRGAQPTAEGVKELEKLGVKTIVNLRAGHSDKKIANDSRLELVQIPTDSWNVSEADVIAFLKIATDEKRRPVFFHCQHGADRTGTMCAAYRIVVQGWTKPQAIDEMTNGGFNFHSVWINLPRLIDKLDVEKIQTALKQK